MTGCKTKMIDDTATDEIFPDDGTPAQSPWGVAWIILILCGIEVLGAFYVTKNWDWSFGIFLGAGFAALSYVLLAHIIIRLISGSYRKPFTIVGLFLLKLVLIALVFWLSFWVLKVIPYSFMLGYGNLPLAITLFGLKKKGPAENPTGP